MLTVITHDGAIALIVREFLKAESRADKCIKCDQCMDKCPQKLPIPELLEKAHAYLTSKD